MRHGARHRGASIANVSDLSSSIPSIHPLAGSQGRGTAAAAAKNSLRGVAKVRKDEIQPKLKP